MARSGSMDRVAQRWRRGAPVFFILAIVGPTILGLSYIVLSAMAGLLGVNEGVAGAVAVFAVALWLPYLLGIFLESDYEHRHAGRNLER